MLEYKEGVNSSQRKSKEDSGGSRGGAAPPPPPHLVDCIFLIPFFPLQNAKK